VLARFASIVAGNAVALGVTAWLLDGMRIDGWVALLLAAIVFGLVNAFLKPAVTILGIPLILLTLGIALFFINMLMLWLTDVVVAGFDIAGFWTYVGATLLVWLINMLLEAFTPLER
jgi:putative membrane protein